jgi:hypothetical protein
MSNTDTQTYLASLRQSVNDLSGITDDTQLSAASTQIQQQLDELNSSMNEQTTTSGEVLTMQDTVSDILKEEQDELQMRKDELDNKIVGKRREVLLKGAQQSRQVEYNKMALVVIIALLVVYLSMIGEYYLPFIPSFLFTLISVIAIVLALVYCFHKFIVIHTRMKTNYDELRKSPPDGVNETSRARSSGEPVDGTYDIGSMACVGSNCCGSGMEYNESTNMCQIEGTIDATTTETFTHKYLADGTHAMENFVKA